jgi:predicted PhzF superfamily epimerase YddE/YHI9
VARRADDARPLQYSEGATPPAAIQRGGLSAALRGRDSSFGVMQIPLYQLDAFADRLFAGNPAAVCPLERWLPDETLRAIAAENNLSETAFVVASGPDYELRWFTPTIEVDLCGHATLAAGHVVLHRLRPGSSSVRFHTRRAGVLGVGSRDGLLVLDFPARAPRPSDPPPGLIDALGGRPSAVLASERDHMVVYGTEAEVARLAPSMPPLAALGPVGVIVTARGERSDFVSRFFAPGAGIPEDPATGSAHCVLTPYWSKLLGKTTLDARQISARGGALRCTLRGERVDIAGKVVPYLEGTISL